MREAFVRTLRKCLGGARPQPRHGLVGRPELWPMKRAFQIDFLREQGLRPSDRVLDIGCGSLRGGAALIAYLDRPGYTGIDVRASVLAEARRELAREKLRGKRPELVQVDEFATLQFDHRFEVIWAFSVLFHLSDSTLQECFELVARHLGDHGRFFANVIFGNGPPGQWQGFPVVARPLETYQALAAPHGLHAGTVGVLEALGHHSGDPSQDNQTMLVFTRLPAP